MSKIIILAFSISALLSFSVNARVKTPGESDPEDHMGKTEELNRQKEEAARKAREALLARTKDKEREIELKAINIISDSEDLNIETAASSKLDDIANGDVSTDEVNAFREKYKIKIQQLLLEKQKIAEEKKQDEILKSIKLN